MVFLFRKCIVQKCLVHHNKCAEVKLCMAYIQNQSKVWTQLLITGFYFIFNSTVQKFGVTEKCPCF
jgi:hypothetical protein